MQTKGNGQSSADGGQGEQNQAAPEPTGDHGHPAATDAPESPGKEEQTQQEGTGGMPEPHGWANFWRRPTVEDIQSGKKLVYVFGRVTYDDAFGGRHRLSYCAQHVPGNPLWTICPNNNSAD